MQKIKKIKNPNKDFTLIFPKEYRNQTWMEEYGEIQFLLRKLSKEEIKIKIDFRYLTWIDPLPLLSLCISIEELEIAIVEILLPEIGANNSESNKLLAFFYSEGFFDQFINNDKIHFYENQTEIIDFTKYGAIIGELQFKDCGIIKIRVINLEEIFSEGYRTIDEWISNLVNKAQFSIRNKVESYRVDEVINRTQRLLSETIANVYEHAYHGNDKKYVGLYIRFRNGLANTKISDIERKVIKQLFVKEQNNSPLLNWWFVDNIFNFIEIFIIDSGIGLSENYFRFKKAPKWPFSKAWEDAVVNGIRGDLNNSKKTQFGGLYSICRNLGHNYVWARDTNQFVGHSLPLRSGIVPAQAINSNNQISGLSLIFRLTWDVASDYETTWERAKFDSGNEDNPYFQELCEQKDIYHRFYGQNLNESLSKSNIFAIDNRFKLIKNYDEIIYSKELVNTKFCFYLPGQFLQKNQIIANVNELFGDINNTSRTLIICDIVPYEANLFELALENSVYSEIFLSSFDSIILITQRSSVLFLEKDVNTYVKNKNLANELLESNPNRFAPHLSLRHIIAWLKTHDSLLFWLILHDKTKISDSFFINGPVKWYRDEDEYEMDGYLIFSQVISEMDVRKLLEAALYRTMSLSYNNGLKFNNIDLLTSQFASKMNALFYNNQSFTNIKEFEILLGSVFATGLSENEAINELENEICQIPLHFFIHPSIKNKNTNHELEIENHKVPHLFLWPKDWIKTHFPINKEDNRRVGRSHVVAPYGWKSYPIPRFRLFDNSIGKFVNDASEITNMDDCKFISAYACTPSESYNDWQITGKQILEFGHFNYENKHDILKIDFPLAVNNSFNEGGKLAVFLLAEFLIALGTDTSSINNEINDIYNFTQKEKTKITDQLLDASLRRFITSVDKYIQNLRDNEKEECAIIAYPSHYNTEHIISVIKEYILNKNDFNLHSKIFPLIPINKERNGTAYLISPSVLEKIRLKILDYKKTGKKAKVLLFDEATIEGKTRKELKHLLFHLGADEVKTLCIIDRQRLPFSTTNPEKHKAYWRLDIPRLGGKDNCMLCKSLEVVSSFKNSLIYSIDRFRVDQWNNAWDSCFPYSKSKFHGLSSKPLIHPITKKFALYIDKASGRALHYENIDLINSTGVALYSGEIHSMTGRDDMAQKLCESLNLHRLMKIEILSVNLLLFGKDFSHQVKYKMVRSIFSEINKSKATSNETALGVLTILSQSHQITESLFELCDKLENDDIELKNPDLELLLSLFSQNKGSVFSNFLTLRRHFGSRYISDIKTVYYNFHHELYNDFGRIHNKALDKALSISPYSEISIDQLNQIISSCENLEDILNHFPLWNTRQLFPKQDAIKLSAQIQSLISLLQKHIENIIDFKNKSTIRNYADSNILFIELDEIKSYINDLKINLFSFHMLLFTKLGIQDQDSFQLKEELNKIIQAHTQENLNYIIDFGHFKKNTEPEYERWLPWDKQIVNKISYIIDNVKHSIGFLDENKLFYKSKPANKHLYNMLISIKYLPTCLQLVFENYSERSHEYILSKALLKNKPEKQHICDLDGRIIYESDINDTNLYLIRTILELPYQ